MKKLIVLLALAIAGCGDNSATQPQPQNDPVVEHVIKLSMGSEPTTAQDLAAYDVAPIINGESHPDGKIGLDDVVAICRLRAGIPLTQ